MKNLNKQLILIVTIVLALLVLLIVFVPLRNNNIEKTRVEVVLDFTTLEIADEAQERATGLMNRTELCNECGMLFVFENENVQEFWMKDTPLPLDIIFIDSDWTVVKISENTKPNQTEERYHSKYKVKYVLEVNAGYTKGNNIDVGDALLIRQNGVPL